MEVVYHRCKMDRKLIYFLVQKTIVVTSHGFFYCRGNIIFYKKFSKHSSRFETLNTILQH